MFVRYRDICDGDLPAAQFPPIMTHMIDVARIELEKDTYEDNSVLERKLKKDDSSPGISLAQWTG